MLPEERSDPNHYIFDKNLDNCLYQGDVLQESLSPEFDELVNKYYSHYDSQFQCNYFLILTQSCDLIRRGNEPPAAEYIGIAPIFPVKKIILKKAQEKQEWWQIDTRVIDHKHFESLALFVGKLLNNNISNYFYIHEDISQNISGFSCAILSLSMVFHIEYYDICLKAKTAQIQDIYRAKLGWNIGNIYSKVGTEEWDIFYPQKKVSTVASSLLKDVFININKEQIEKGKKKLTEHKKLSQYTSEEIFENIKNTKIIPKIKQFTDRTNTLLKDLDLISPICSRLLEASFMNATFSISTSLSNSFISNGTFLFPKNLVFIIKLLPEFSVLN